MSTQLDVLIVGGGFSGLGMAVTLQREAKRSWLLLEKGAGVGGTWRENHYPGCACDVPSHLYSFSFAPNPAWSHHFAPQPEILSYLEGVAQKEGVLANCRFGVEVVSCDFDERAALWTVTTKAGERYRARHVVLGVGALHNAKFPEVPGRARFKGAQVHSAQWDGALNLEGKRVALVGTGASAIQVLPSIAPVAKHVTVVQRTPAWVLPRGDHEISGVMRWLYTVVPMLRLLRRATIYAAFESRIVAFTRFPWLLRAAEWLGKRHMRVIKSAETREKLTPSYAPGCKRILLSDEYYPAFNRENVTLETGGVKEVTETGVVTADGREHECDVIAWCTGFDLAAPLAAMKVTGRSGRELARDAWKHGLQAYRGTTVPGFPNFYLLMGPNTGLGHNSMVYVIESQIRFVMKHLEACDAANARAIEVKEEATTAFNELIQSRFPGTVWSSGCASWYLDASGKNRTLWPGTTFAFRALTSELNLEDMQLDATPVISTVPHEAA